MENNAKRLLKFEYYSLCIIAISIPLLEVPKHLFCIIYLLLFCYRSLRYKETFQSSPLSKYILFFVAGSIITSIGAAYNGYEIEKLHDIIRYSLIGLLIIHTPFSQKQLYTVCILLIASSLIACIEGYYLYQQGLEEYFELKSVGHINHSAIYILLSIGISLPLILKTFNNKKVWACCLFINILLLFFLLKTDSRATLIGFTCVLLILVGTLFHLNKKAFILSLVLGASSLGAALLYQPTVITKFSERHQQFKGESTPRERIWNTAIYAWKKEPIFGIGFGNYTIITPQKMQEWYKDSAIDVNNKKQFLYISHAHNRFINTLTEGGIIGLLSLLGFLGGSLFLLYKFLIQTNGNIDHLFYWLIGANTLTTIVIVGLFNTTLHHEHGLLSMMLVGICFNYLHSSIPLRKNPL